MQHDKQQPPLFLGGVWDWRGAAERCAASVATRVKESLTDVVGLERVWRGALRGGGRGAAGRGGRGRGGGGAAGAAAGAAAGGVGPGGGVRGGRGAGRARGRGRGRGRSRRGGSGSEDDDDESEDEEDEEEQGYSGEQEDRAEEAGLQEQGGAAAAMPAAAVAAAAGGAAGAFAGWQEPPCDPAVWRPAALSILRAVMREPAAHEFNAPVSVEEVRRAGRRVCDGVRGLGVCPMERREDCC